MFSFGRMMPPEVFSGRIKMPTRTRSVKTSMPERSPRAAVIAFRGSAPWAIISILEALAIGIKISTQFKIRFFTHLERVIEAANFPDKFAVELMAQIPREDGIDELLLLCRNEAL